MKKLMLGLMMAFAVTAEAETIDGINYAFDVGAGTAIIMGYDSGNPPTKVDVAEVEWEGKNYIVTTIGGRAFYQCENLKEVSFPNATTIGMEAFFQCENLKEVSFPNATTIERNAFSRCENLTSVFSPFVTTIEESAFSSCFALPNLVVNIAMKAAIEANGTAYYGIPNNTTITYYDGYSYSVLEKAEYQMTMKSGDTAIDEDKYKKSCEFLGLTPKEKPQVVKEGEIAVTKESLQAAKAETVEIVGGMVYLGVSVLSNSDITASTAWAPVKFSEGTQIGLSTDGTKLIIPIPAAAQSGFMILQSGEGKIVTSGGGPTPTADNSDHCIRIDGGRIIGSHDRDIPDDYGVERSGDPGNPGGSEIYHGGDL